MRARVSRSIGQFQLSWQPVHLALHYKTPTAEEEEEGGRKRERAITNLEQTNSETNHVTSLTVRLFLRSCMMRVESLYKSSSSWSRLVTALSNVFFAIADFFKVLHDLVVEDRQIEGQPYCVSRWHFFCNVII